MTRWNDGELFSRRIELAYMLCDRNRRLHVSNLMGLTDEVGLDCDEFFGFGMDYYYKHGQSYVMTRVSMRIFELPECRETVICSGCYTGVWDNRFHRDMEMRSLDGRLLAGMRIEQVLFDPQERRALSIADELHLTLPQPSGHRTDAPECRKILVEGELPLLGTKIVMFSDIDDNWHMTYVSYLRTAVDFLPETIREGGYRDIVLNFVRETAEGETLELRGGQTEGGYVIQAFAGGRLRFCAEFSGKG
jgi:acyl-ACP thioesterase